MHVYSYKTKSWTEWMSARTSSKLTILCFYAQPSTAFSLRLCRIPQSVRWQHILPHWHNNQRKVHQHVDDTRSISDVSVNIVQPRNRISEGAVLYKQKTSERVFLCSYRKSVLSFVSGRSLVLRMLSFFFSVGYHMLGIAFRLFKLPQRDLTRIGQ